MTNTRTCMLMAGKLALFSSLLMATSTSLAQSGIELDGVALPAPTPYAATYQARAMGFRTEAYRQLNLQQDDSYHVRHGLELSVLGATLISVEESSQFNWSDRGAVPLDYHYRQGGVRKRDERISFDWDSSIAMMNRDERQKQAELQGGLLDNLSFTAQMSADLLRLAQTTDLTAGGQTLQYELMDWNEVDIHTYTIVGAERIETLLGEVDTLKIERVRAPERDRSTTIWLAVDHEYTLARLEQVEGGTRTELLLKSIEMNQ
ncbi:DUF3108 domain-containing protein [Pseudohongiella spirulinae]|uniref:DUF3108 domain-containing protein n=1 Tax=Pseudohongiella spirulinae TaxID=1249552 RepID=A0A0S2KEA4_9GAMM|nr:DUF3108 domain-containing protein [Pseudohongiella spirulinae]ALO46640.1 hypothetical protein PS2015_1999 [Pseudohongiella spirulinae]